MLSWISALFSLLIFVLPYAILAYAFFYCFHHSGLLYLLISAYNDGPAPPPFRLDELKSRKRSKPPRTALILGGSGGVGRAILKALAAAPEYTRVTLLLRKEAMARIVLPPSPKFEKKLIDFDNLNDPAVLQLFRGCDTAFYSLGVYAGFVSEEEYLHVERDNALQLAKLMKEGGIKDVHWVTAIGTSTKSPFLFGRVKAGVEESVGALGFRKAAFYRPGGVLTSDESGLFGVGRIRLMKVLDVWRWLNVDGDEMGRVMVDNSLRVVGGGDGRVEIFKNGDIVKYARIVKAG